MNEALERVAERLRQLHAARRDKLQASQNTGSRGADGRSGALTLNTRVFDTVSGEEGEIVGRTTENLIVPAAAK
jgi:hypothetical protein